MSENLPETRNVTPVARLKTILDSPTVQEQFQNALKDNSPLFVASLIDLYSSDNRLQQCQPKAVVMEALKAATLKLPINKNLGFAWVIPYNNSKKVGNQWTKVMEPVFQMGYKGYIQLAMRTGQYRFINADKVYDGELMQQNKLTGEIVLNGEKKSDKVIGYFAYMETVNGFQKVMYWPIEEVQAHAKKYSPNYDHPKGRWKLDFNSMAIKTMLIQLLSKYGVMSVEMQTALSTDIDNQYNPQDEIDQRGNRKQIDFGADENQESGEVFDMTDTGEMTAEEQAEIEAAEAAEAEQMTGTDDPGY